MKDSIYRVGDGKIIVEANGKESKTRFFIFRARLAYAKLRQAFNTALILHHFYSKYHI